MNRSPASAAPPACATAWWLLLFTACGPQSLPKGETYESLDGSLTLRVQSESLIDFQHAPAPMVQAQYTIEDDGTVRITHDVAGTTQVVLLEAVEEGLLYEGETLYSSDLLTQARAQKSAEEIASAAKGARTLAETGSPEEALAAIQAALSAYPSSSALHKLQRDLLEATEARLLDLFATSRFNELIEVLTKAESSLGASSLEAQALKASLVQAGTARARELIEASQYAEAHTMLQAVSTLDPTSEVLAALEAEIQEHRYMTRSRFAALAVGMTKHEVRSQLGAPLPQNTREYPEKDIVAWFYRRKDGGAAGVFFRGPRVHSFDFDAVNP